jgi:hypothetical protein
MGGIIGMCRQFAAVRGLGGFEQFVESVAVIAKKRLANRPVHDVPADNLTRP